MPFRIREVEGSNPFGSTKDRLVRAGLFFYAVIYTKATKDRLVRAGLFFYAVIYTKGCSFIP